MTTKHNEATARPDGQAADEGWSSDVNFERAQISLHGPPQGSPPIVVEVGRALGPKWTTDDLRQLAKAMQDALNGS